MNPAPTEPGRRLFDLLPAIYRLRDAARAGAANEHGPLRALLEVIGRELGVLEAELDQLYDDQFIETCAEWVVPYLGDLLGVRELRHPPNDLTTHRAYVANTLGYRRRKGTASVLEGLARDLTGLDVHVVEFFRQLLTTQHLNHIRPEITTVGLRRWEPLERLRSPFNTTAHTADVRRIQPRRGRFNIPNVGIFLWRARGWVLTDSPAVPLADGRRLLFNPLGLDAPLFTRPAPPRADDPNAPAGPFRAPLRLSRRVLAAYLDDLYGAGSDKSLSLVVDGNPVPGPGAKPSTELSVCDLSDLPGSPGPDWAHVPAAGGKIAIDPVLGRIALPPELANRPVRVTFHYGFTAPMGGGSYPRPESAAEDSGGTAVKVGRSETLKKIADGIAAVVAGGAGGGIEITDSGRYEEALSIHVGANKVEIRAAQNHRPTVVLTAAMAITGVAGGALTLDGLLIAKAGLAVSGAIDALTIRHCTLVPGQEFDRAGTPLRPGAPSVVVSGGTKVTIDHCITGGLRVPELAPELTVLDSIIDSPAAPAIAANDTGTVPAPAVVLKQVTVTGRVFVRELTVASDVIFLKPVTTVRRQAGCVRFCYLADGSLTPPRFQCQPPTGASGPTVRPAFASLRYGDPDYARLSGRCPPEVAQGGSDEGEMGAFHDLYYPINEANLRLALDEYLRFALEAGIFPEP